MTALRIKTSDKNIYNDFMKKDVFEVSGIYGLEEDVKIGLPVFLLFGGNGDTDWVKGCAGICSVNSKPYDAGYKKTDGGKNYYKIKVKVLFRFENFIEKKDLILYPGSYDTGIGPSTKGEPNQALGKIEDDKALEAICRAFIDWENDKEQKLIEIFGESIINSAKENVDLLVYKSKREWDVRNLNELENYDNTEFAKELITILQTNPNITPFIIYQLQDKKFCAEVLKTYYPLLLKVNPDISVEELRVFAKYNTERQRYYYDLYELYGSTYLITNDLYKTRSKNIQKIVSWLKQFFPPKFNLTESKDFILDKSLFKEPVSERFIKSLLAKPFTILTGNSGTGKTRIATNFSEWLAKESDSGIKNSLIVPVGADWTDNTKVLGYYNPLADGGTGKYEKTEIFKFLELANFNPKIPFFLIFDEMNLSHVERYFSDFLSKMELVNYSDDNSKTYFEIDNYGKLEFPKNLFITGTVNIDETTYMFSPKVLDRANVIEFTPKSSVILENFKEDTSPIEITPVNNGSAEGFLSLAKQIRALRKLPSNTAEAEKILESLAWILSDTGFEFAYRTVKEIRLYLNAATKLAENEKQKLDEKEYISLMDEQLLQKILPKIHGNRSQIGTLLKNLYDFCDKKVVKLNETTTIQGYSLPLSKAKIGRMQKQLETSQFASFI